MVPPSKPLKRKAASTVPKRPAKKAKVSVADDDDAACLITDVEMPTSVLSGWISDIALSMRSGKEASVRH